jgi:hypothetical protein
MAALQHSEPLLVKLHNYKANGQKFQCLFALHPIFGPNQEYKFQIGCQIDFTMGPDITRQLLLMESVLRLMPHSMTGEDAEDMLKVMPTDIMGDGTIFPLINVDPSAMNTAAAAPAGGGKKNEIVSLISLPLSPPVTHLSPSHTLLLLCISLKPLYCIYHRFSSVVSLTLYSIFLTPIIIA